MAPGAGSSRPAGSLNESKVGIQTIPQPTRAATSTAIGLRPPTARLSVIDPITSVPGSAALTTAARSAVGA